MAWLLQMEGLEILVNWGIGFTITGIDNGKPIQPESTGVTL